MRLLHVLSIGIACGLGAHFGRKLATILGFCSLLSSPLKAQMWFGDTLWVHENRDSRGYFYLDTTETVGWVKHDAKRPWVYELQHSIEYRDWWFETASCQSMQTNPMEFYRFHFFAVNRETFGGLGPNQIGYWGYTLTDSLAIYIAAPQIHNKNTLQHEITHALMWYRHEKAGHPWKRFGDFGCGLSYVTPETADKPK